MRVVFMGTPDISKVCLERILADGFDVVGVFTQPDRPRDRGMKRMASPVKQLALERGLPVFQPERFSAPEAVQQLRELRPDVVAVVAYGKILPQTVLDVPPLGCINIHASLLPHYRGAAPYQWAVLNGETQTGVTAMYLCAQMDAGDMIDTETTCIGENETAGELLERLAVLGAGLLSRTLRRVEFGTAPRLPQDESAATYAPMLDKRLSLIDWTKPAGQIHNQVRGLNPWPVATAWLCGRKFKIYSTVVVEGTGEPGRILGLTKTGVRVACGQDALEIRVLQAEGGKRMAAPDYFRGHPLEG